MVETLTWIVFPLLIGGGSAMIAWTIMRERMETELSRQRESMADIRAQLRYADMNVADRVRAAEETVRRTALDDFLADLHVEERRYVRENRLRFSERKSMIVQERLWFRNIPLSNWVENELTLENGDSRKLARTFSVFNAALLPEPPQEAKLLQ